MVAKRVLSRRVNFINILGIQYYPHGHSLQEYNVICAAKASLAVMLSDARDVGQDPSSGIHT